MIGPDRTPTSAPSDADLHEPHPLLARASKGDQDAWRAIVDRYGRRVYAFVRAKSLDPGSAEEVTQSVFATVAQRLPGGGYEERGRFEAWLFRIAANRARDELRRRRRRPEVQDHRAAEARPAPPPLAGTPDHATLRRAIEALGEADREVIHLRHHAQMSFKQIAEWLGEPLGTLLARHHRALRKLRDLLHDDQEPAP